MAVLIPSQYDSTHRGLVIAIHDIAPPFEPEIRAMLAMLASAGVRRYVLKVVPNWHGAHPLPAAPRLADLLRSEHAAGSELVLHGLEHRRHGCLRGQPLDRVRAALFAGSAAEFLTLTPAEASRAVRDGLDLFARAGLPRPSAFCAPGWLVTAEAQQAICDAGIPRLVGMFTVRDLRTSRGCVVPAFGYMGASLWQESAVAVLNALVVRLALGRTRAAKAYLHPQGGLNGGRMQRVLDRISRMVAEDGWRPATYAELCGYD